MPVSYRYDPESNAVLTHPTGVITVADICAYFERVSRDPQVVPGFVEIVRFDDAEDFAFSYTETALVFDAYNKLMLTKQCARTVFIARNPIGYGMARMFGSAIGEHADLRVVRSEDELQQELSDIRTGRINLEP